MTNSIQEDENLVNARNEVFRKVGRNLYLYQQIEKLLKKLNSIAEISGYMSELEENQRQKANKLGVMNMGSLVGQFIDSIYTNSDKSSNSPELIKEPYFSINFAIQADPEFIEQRKKALKLFVDDRNHLVHHLFIDADIASIERCAEIEAYLDAQRERIITEHEQLRFIAQTYSDIAKAHADFINSDEGERHIELSHLQQSDLVRMLLEVSINQARADGWTLLNHAGNELRKVIPEEMTDLKRMYGYKTLKAAIRASEMFDLLEEETSQGSRLVYRPKVEILSEYLRK